jgi:hypothetical protein
LVPFTSCTPTSLCTAEHSSACSFSAYAHILYTDFTVHRITHLCPCHPCVSTHSTICVESGIWWWLNYVTTGWSYPILYLYICWMDGGDIIHTWFIDFCDIPTGGSLVWVTYCCLMFVLPTTVTSTSSGLTEVEFILRSYSCCGQSRVTIIDNYSATVPAAFSLPTSLWKRKSVSWMLCEYLGRKYPPFMNPDKSFPCSHKLTTGSYPKPDKTSVLVCFSILEDVNWLVGCLTLKVSHL